MTVFRLRIDCDNESAATYIGLRSLVKNVFERLKRFATVAPVRKEWGERLMDENGNTVGEMCVSEFDAVEVGPLDCGRIIGLLGALAAPETDVSQSQKEMARELIAMLSEGAKKAGFQ